MATLTYRPGDGWRATHIRRCHNAVARWSRRRGVTLPYVWVAELQLERLLHTQASPASVVHYHVLFWLPKVLTMPKADKQGWWPHGATRTERARHAAGYIAKYASKGGAGLRLPKG